MPELEYRFLGRTGLKVSVISLGSWITYGGHVADESAFESMKVAYDAGVNFFDTAENYSAGQAEIVLGKAIKHFGWKQNDLVISTKIYFGQNNSANPSRPLNNKGLSRKHIIEGLDASLARLQLPYVDVVYAHRPDRDTPIEETVRAFNHVISTGKAFYWGTSEWSAAEIADAWRAADSLGLIGPAVEQPQYNLLVRERVESEFRWLYEKYGTGLTIWSPLKQGILTGKYNGVDKPPADSRLANATDPFSVQYSKTFGDETWKAELAQVEKLRPISEELGVSLAALAIAWTVKNKNVSSVIIGASRPEQVTENIQALDVVEKLTPEILEKIDSALGNKPVEQFRRL
ncbi:Aldo/keto reductase [Cucurbitaria berberidis CBS 394.84]|uniref:Aldo/keto reductase n=1 Tax=Cucurbitaria berberidis CBS 394.84 TaxID=1168544 RepID=A0A9P4GJF2_9PLEO|nr:Aldo/keto reductase [Cucurbitaria berberidis CBS 394.84]KAF1847348.1 Aldo/keto reductase [Cucurbitaria berberidis CBS 394.84]